LFCRQNNLGTSADGGESLPGESFCDPRNYLNKVIRIKQGKPDTGQALAIAGNENYNSE
jgi:hypothetical protein